MGNFLSGIISIKLVNKIVNAQENKELYYTDKNFISNIFSQIKIYNTTNENLFIFDGDSYTFDEIKTKTQNIKNGTDEKFYKFSYTGLKLIGPLIIGPWSESFKKIKPSDKDYLSNYPASTFLEPNWNKICILNSNAEIILNIDVIKGHHYYILVDALQNRI
jgi:hypothetical protein